MTADKILMIDDEPDKIFIFTTILKRHGFQVATAQNGADGLTRIADFRPDLVLLDINMPEISGHTIRERLKQRPATRNVPIVMFSSSDQLTDKLYSLKTGADDYITKDVDHQELVARLEALIRRYKESIGTNPLTRLPGNYAIEEDINLRLSAAEPHRPFAVCYADLDHFKAFNDVYGFSRGDEVIRKTAEVLTDVIAEAGAPDDFVGHIGGDDFVFVLSDCGRIDAVCAEIIRRLSEYFPTLYSDADRARGYIQTKNRKDQTDQFPLISISIAVVSNENRALTSVGQIAQIASEIKKLLKTKPGSNYSVDRRT